MSDPVAEPFDSTDRLVPITGAEDVAPSIIVRAAEVVLVIFLYVVLMSLCQEALTVLGVFDWYYGPGFKNQAEYSPDKEGKEEDAATRAKRSQQANLARIRRGLWATVIAAPLQIIAIPVFLSVTSRTQPRQLGLTTRRLGLNLLCGVGVWLVIMPLVLAINYLTQYLYQYAFNIIPEEHPFTQLAQHGGMTPWEWTLWICATVVAAPVVEELAFRGFLQTWLGYLPRGPEIAVGLGGVVAIMNRSQAIGNAWAQGFAVMVEAFAPLLFVLILFAGLPLVRRLRPEMAVVWGSAALFAMVHTGVWPTPIPLFVLGLALGELFRRTGSLVGPMVVHALFNGTSVALFLIQ